MMSEKTAAQGQMPLVSIIINCFNGEQYLREAIDSVLAQSYRKWEIVFWDNASSDNSPQIVNEYTDSRIKYFRAPDTTPLYEARNLAIEKASGDLIAFLDVDDWWAPNKLERQVALFSSDNELAVVYSNYWRVAQFDGSKKEIKSRIDSASLTNSLLNKFDIALPTLMIKKEQVGSGKFFDGAYNLIGDFDFVLNLSLNKKFKCVDEPLAFYRIHGNNETSKSYKSWAREFSWWQNKNHQKFSVYNNYAKISEIIHFHNVLDAKLNGDGWRVFRYLITNPRSIFELKLMAVALTPLRILNWIRGYKHHRH